MTSRAPSPEDDRLADLWEAVSGAASTAERAGWRLAELEVLPGGHSGLTHIARFVSPNGCERRVVIKSTPLGREARGRHDVLRQARVLESLAQVEGLPVPRVLFTSAARPPLFAMTLADGLASEPTMEPPRPDERAAEIAAAWRDAVAVLQRLQSRDPPTLGVHDPVTTAHAELARWRATMDAAGRGGDPAARRLHDGLASSVPPEGPACVVHGDFRLGNMLRRDGVINALVDWEIWSVGDPRLDLGWLVLFTDPTLFPGGVGREVPGTPTAVEVVDGYFATASALARDGVAWFEALACFKLAAVQAHNLRRHREGRYRDAHQERMAASTDTLLRRGLTLLG